MIFREILNSSLHAHVCSRSLSKDLAFIQHFFKCQFFLHLLNLQLNGEAHHTDTVVKPYLNSFEIKA